MPANSDGENEITFGDETPTDDQQVYNSADEENDNNNNNNNNNNNDFNNNNDEQGEAEFTFDQVQSEPQPTLEDEGIVDERIPEEGTQNQPIDDDVYKELYGDGNAEEEEEEGEDLFADEALEKDYMEIPEQDMYEDQGIDNTEYGYLDLNQRRAAENKMRKRDQERVRIKGRLPAALQAMEEDYYDEEGFPVNNSYPQKERPTMGSMPLNLILQDNQYDDGADVDNDDDEDPFANTENLEEFHGPLKEWIVTEGPRRAIASLFKSFLLQYMDQSGVNIYEERIDKMTSQNKSSLEVSYIHLGKFYPTLSVWLADEPEEMLSIFNDVALEVVLKKYPHYTEITDNVFVRISDLPIKESIRDLRQIHLNGLVRVSGVITRRTGVFPQLQMVKFNCDKCGQIIGPLAQKGNQEVKPSTCPQCQSKGGFTLNMAETVYRNYQKLVLQESPGTVPAGRLPRSKEVVLLDDLIDIARPGEEIEITGIYRNNYDASLNSKQGFPVFATVIEANYIRKKADLMSSFMLTEEDKSTIRRLSKDPAIVDKIIHSIAPSIFGHEDIKTALALSLFGGEQKTDVEGHRVRGDINVLLMGDPGTAKSQFLKYVEKTANRAVFTTGKGSTAVGLTAAVHRDPVTSEWTLEGGALVLADTGVCLIDEFDKMNDQDRTSIHEAMEQQSISISKAGIVTTLRAQCSILAAANPIKGRYDPSRTFQQNVELSDPILSRFDILRVVRDTVDPIEDEKLANFVVDSHVKSHPKNKTQENDEEEQNESDHIEDVSSIQIIPQHLLRKYIMYAKQQHHPKLNNIDQEKIGQFYSELRRESQMGGGMPVSVRHVESLIRMSEAFARMHLRDYVRSDDVNRAIAVFLDSFISCQKYSVMRSLRRKFAKYLTANKDHNQLLLHVLLTLVRETCHYKNVLTGGMDDDKVEIECDEFEARARELDIYNVEPFYSSNLFTQNNFKLDRSKKLITKEF